MDESLLRRDYLEEAGDLAPVSLVDDAVSEERSNRTATLRTEPASRRTDRQQLPLLGSSLVHLARIPLRKNSTAAFRCRSSVFGSVAVP